MHKLLNEEIAMQKVENNELPEEIEITSTEERTEEKVVPIKRRVYVSLALLFVILISLVVLRKISSNPYISERVSTFLQIELENFSEEKNKVQQSEAFVAFSFIPYREIKTPYQAKIPEYSISWQNLANHDSFLKPNLSVNTLFEANIIDFSSENIQKLESQHALTAPVGGSFFSSDLNNEDDSRTDDWTTLYTKIGGNSNPCKRYPENSVFISTDFLEHMYHRIIQRQMEYMDKEEFAPKLLQLSKQLLEKANIELDKSSEQNKESWKRVVAYFSVPYVLLENIDQGSDASDALEAAISSLQKLQIHEDSRTLVEQELTKIMAADSVSQSVIFTGTTPDKESYDYTQFTPRSYYNKNNVLRSYFRAMMWYGRTGFNLSHKGLTRDALNITRIMASDDLLNMWQAIYVPTSFLVGVSDDLSFNDYLPYIKEQEINDELISLVQSKAKEFTKPQIFSDIVVKDKVFDQTEEELLQESLGFRFMGQRFTPDAFILNSLTQGNTLPDPETGERLPSSPTALMVASSLGSKTAESYLEKWTDEHAPNSKQVLNKKLGEMKNTFTALGNEDWTQNAYFSWMFLYKTLIQDDKDWKGYPRFMSFDFWRTKDLNAFLGSWTELKHDTLLYAKQSYAEKGGGGLECEILPVPKGYVEPNIEFFDRLEALVTMSSENFKKLEVLNSEIETRIDQFLESLRFFRSIAVKELSNEVISDEDFEELRMKAGRMTYLAQVLSGEVQTEREARSALIADIHTDAVTEQIVYEATGIPRYIYVAVSDANGARLVKGLVFSHYEFSAPLNQQRLNDESWWTKVYDKQSEMPVSPPWSH